MSLVASDFFTDMSRFDARNFVSTELNADITVAQTVVAVKDSTVWPSLDAGSFFIAVITHATDNSKKEVVKVTGISGANWTIQREYEGNQSYAFPAGSSIECRLTAATIGAIRGVSYKKTPHNMTITAKPHTEYLMDAGHSIRIYPATMEEGSIIRATALITSANNPVTVLDAGGAVLVTLGTAGSFAEFCTIGGAAVMTKLYRNPNPDYVKYSASFAAIPNLRALVDMSDDVNKTVTIADGFADSSSITLNFTEWGANVAGKNAVIQMQTEVLVGNDGQHESLLIDAPCVVTLERVAGRWYVVSCSYSGDYGQLENRVDVLEDAKTLWDNGASAPINNATITLSADFTKYRDLLFRFQPNAGSGAEIVEVLVSSDLLNTVESTRVGLFVSINYYASVVVSKVSTTQLQIKYPVIEGWTGSGITKIRGTN